MTLRDVYGVLRGAYTRFTQDDGIAMAGYIAFSNLLAVFPFLIFAASLAGILVGPAQGQDIIDALFRFAPENIAETLKPVLDEILQGRGTRYLTVSLVGAVWLASNAFESFRVAFDRAYGEGQKRGYFRRRARALGFVFLGGVASGVFGVAVIFAPVFMRFAARWSHIRFSGGAVAASYVLGVLVFTLFLILMHRYLPSHRMKGLRLWPGVLVTVVLWVAGAMVFSYYLTLTPTYAITYGTLSGVIITLVFFYLSGVAVIFGAELNAELNFRDATQKPT